MKQRAILVAEKDAPRLKRTQGFAIAIVCGSGDAGSPPPKPQVVTVFNKEEHSTSLEVSRLVTAMWHTVNQANLRPCRVEQYPVDILHTPVIGDRAGNAKTWMVLANQKSEGLDFTRSGVWYSA